MVNRLLKISLTFLAWLIGVYLIGNKVRVNPKIDSIVSLVELRYSIINRKLEEATVRSGLMLLRRFYGLASITAGIIIITAQYIINDINLLLNGFWIFSFFFMSWLSIKWVLDHKKTIASSFKMKRLLILVPVLFGLIDLFIETSLTDKLFSPIKILASTLHITLPNTTNSIYMGFTLSIIIISFLAIDYLLTWLITTPIFMISILAVTTSINIARFLAKIDRNNTFFWLSIFTLLVTSVCLSQL